ncbi:hypothetical protein GEMRC1_008704 [Eukaryota sp. GEM-RC1]
MSKITKAHLLHWISQLSKSRVTSFDDLIDGSVFIRVLARLFPKSLNHLYKNTPPPPNDTELRNYTNLILSTLKSVAIPINIVDIKGIFQGKFRASYNFVVLLYFLHQLTISADFSVDFEFPVSNAIAGFLQSNQSVESLIKGGGLCLKKDQVSNALFLQTSTPQTPKRTPLGSPQSPRHQVRTNIGQNDHVNRSREQKVESVVNTPVKASSKQVKPEKKITTLEASRVSDKENDRLTKENQMLINKIKELNSVNKSMLTEIKELKSMPELEGVTDFAVAYAELNNLLSRELSCECGQNFNTILKLIQKVHGEYFIATKTNTVLKTNLSSLTQDHHALKTELQEINSFYQNQISLIKKESILQSEKLKNEYDRKLSFTESRLDLTWKQLAFAQEELQSMIKNQAQSIKTKTQSVSDWSVELSDRVMKLSNKVLIFNKREDVWNELYQKQSQLIDCVKSGKPEADSISAEINKLLEQLTAFETEDDVDAESPLTSLESLESHVRDIEAQLIEEKSLKTQQNAMICDLKASIKRLSLEIEESSFDCSLELKTQIAQLQQSLGEKNEEKKVLEKKFVELEKKFQDNEIQLSKLKELNECASMINQNKDQNDDVDDDITSMLNEEVERLQSELKTRTNELEQLQVQLAENNEEKQELLTNISNLQQQLDQINDSQPPSLQSTTLNQTEPNPSDSANLSTSPFVPERPDSPPEFIDSEQLNDTFFESNGQEKQEELLVVEEPVDGDVDSNPQDDSL